MIYTVYSSPRQKVFRVIARLLPQAVSSKITIDYRRYETELSSEFTAAVSIADEIRGS